jgi:hypothetical protein
MFDAPSAAKRIEVDAAYIQPTLSHGLRVWWAYYWPTTLIVGLLAYCVSYWVRIFYDRLVIEALTAKVALFVSPYLLTAATGLLIFRYLLGKRFRHFRLALVPPGYNVGSPPIPPIWRRTIRVWWTFTWRAVIYGIVLAFLLSIPMGAFFGMFVGTTNRFLAILIPLVEQLIIAGGVGLFVMYSNVLDEDFSDFRVVLLPREAPAPQAPIAAGLPPQTQATS